MSDQFDQVHLQENAVALVEAARKAGADAADVAAVRSVALGVDVRLGKVEETTRSESDDFSLRVFVGQRVASVSANRSEDRGDLAERAVAMAKVALVSLSMSGCRRPAIHAISLPNCFWSGYCRFTSAML